jgi:small subunit ribosomal protein S21
MKEVVKKENERFDGLMRRFRQMCLKDTLFTEMRKREYFIPPSVLRKKKRAKKAKKSRK